MFFTNPDFKNPDPSVFFALIYSKSTNKSCIQFFIKAQMMLFDKVLEEPKLNFFVRFYGFGFCSDPDLETLFKINIFN